MNKPFTKKQLSLGLACALALGFASAAARAQDFKPAAQRGLVSNANGQFWKNGYGECWHSRFGPAPQPNSQCDPNFRLVAPRAEAKT